MPNRTTYGEIEASNLSIGPTKASQPKLENGASYRTRRPTEPFSAKVGTGDPGGARADTTA